ncbi:MAG: putative peptidoglycan glycosyltransferase FtsW [Candidatus Gribaldobacteria bacterium]|nr:putative peptidoglycan glycosyltransferase FtsW [Candidatus Gribaldobacteria bacterium]
MPQQSKIDYLILIPIIFLTIWGILTVSTTSVPLSIKNFGYPWYYLIHQSILLMAGIVLGFIFYKLKSETLKRWSVYLFVANLVALLLVFIPKLGLELHGAHRWLDFGYFTVQPSEFLKITFPLFLVAWLAKRLEGRGSKRKEGQGFLKLFLPFALTIGVIFFIFYLQSDISTLIIVAATVMMMYFLAGTPLWHSFALVGLGVGSILIFIISSAYRLERFKTFLHFEAINPLDAAYQVNQIAIGIGSGGWLGIGSGLALGLSHQKMLLPFAISDSIFAIIGEELGFFGVALLISLLIFFIWRGFKIANHLEDNFERILALGIVFWIAFQAFFNIAGNIGVAPLGGVPLPFFSYGGSHIIVEMIGMGILLKLSKKSVITN